MKLIAGIVTLLMTSAGWAQVNVHSATYGANCGAWQGNATQDVRYRCNGQQICDYYISVSNLGDPAPGCPKNFDVTYSCGWGASKTESVFQEANGKVARLNCSNPPPTWGINVRSATYGLNVGAGYGNVTSRVGSVCNGRQHCAYYVSTQELGDPVPGHAKDFRVEYTCGNGQVRYASAQAEANGATVTLHCN